ncbi:hypothetical protein [Deinococcus roseus]|uniref:PH domain-containing protein n=1 Tax=Deinococcus roseus TaxID=392414 RepID=A0ABQ2DAC5_9DEIO|nr:hypothetical protein [Deinococcus roseus]GGJ48966.1 hypothetical protein GCM10008938_38680 [Deinococcus roseus]
MKEWLQALQAEAAEIPDPTERLWWLVTGILGLYLKGVHMQLMKSGSAVFLVLLAALFTVWNANHTLLGFPMSWLVLTALGILARVLKVSHRTLLFSTVLYIPLCHLTDVLTPMTVPFSFDVQEGALALVLMMLGWNFPVKHFGKESFVGKLAQQNALFLWMLGMLGSMLLVLAHPQAPTFLQGVLLVGTCLLLGSLFWKNLSWKKLGGFSVAFALLLPVALYFTVPLYGSRVLYSIFGPWQLPGYIAPQWSMLMVLLILLSALVSRHVLPRKPRLA